MTEEQLDKIHKLLFQITIYAHRDKLAHDGEMEYLPNEHKRSGTISFPPESMLKYAGMSVTKSGGTYWLKFKAIGELKEILQSANLPLQFNSLLLNTKFYKSMILTEEDDIKKLFWQSQFIKKIDLNSVTYESADKAISDIEQLFLFKKITHF